MYFIFTTILAALLPIGLMVLFPANEASDLHMFITTISYIGASFIFWLGIAYAGTIMLFNLTPDKYLNYTEKKTSEKLERIMSFASKKYTQHYYGEFSIRKHRVIFNYKTASMSKFKKFATVAGENVFLRYVATDSPYVITEKKYKSNKIISPFKFRYSTKVNVYAREETILHALAPEDSVLADY